MAAALASRPRVRGRFLERLAAEKGLVMDRPWKLSPAKVAGALPLDPAAMRFAYGLRHGTLKVGLYGPAGADVQTPHKQDELYVIVGGTADFVRQDEWVACAAHDVLFVEAGQAHRFENMSADFSTWVVFWGPDGGERSS